jgi:branched-chain amino acid aminotransferase
MGVGDGIGVSPAKEYIFSIFVVPVGAYFKGGLTPAKFMVSEFDRAAPQGTGSAKVAGNYAASLKPAKIAKEQGYAEAIYLDPATKTKIEEVGAANFFGITKDGKFITPDSPSILPSITKYSLLELARTRLGMEAIEGEIFVKDLDQFAEAGACGTAAVITPIGSITHGETKYVFHSETEVGPTIKRLYDELVGIQLGDIEAPAGWIQKVEI